MKKANPYLRAALLLSFVGGGCVREIAEPEEHLASFAVSFDWEQAPSPGNPDVTCQFNGATDLCPGAPGTRGDPIAFPGERWAQVHLDIEAVGSKGTRPFPIDAQVAITTRNGEIFGPNRFVTLSAGRADDVRVRFRRTPGETYLWVQDSQPRFEEGEEPTYVSGVTTEPLFFAQPTIPDLQRTDDECCSPMQGQRVEVTAGELYVTRLTGNGLNLQDVSSPDFGGMFVFAFNGTEGLRVGAKLLAISGAVTEFQSSTQLTEPVYTPVNGICGDPRGFSDGFEDSTNEDLEGGGGSARARCPAGAECKRDDEGVERCIPDSSDELDSFGRRLCEPGGLNNCPTGTSCQTIEGQGAFCQVTPLPMEPEAFPEAPYCGPTNTQNVRNNDGTLAVEALEGSLVRLEGTGSLGVRLSGLPVCAAPDVEDPVMAVRSTCNLSTPEGKPVNLVDCTVAGIGDTILRDENDQVCFRGNQACAAQPNVTWHDVRSTCNDDPSLSRCTLAEPGDDVLTNCEPESPTCDPLEDPDLKICRNTLDDFLTGGFVDFAQSKVFFEDESGTTRCATVNFENLTAFDTFATQEQGVRWRSITGTLRQVRFRSATSFWVIDVRFPEDLEPLNP